ncbi:hypothetical protein THAOC_08269 [Thalassiosira oceanica]|uniref:Heme oxygenase (biliverdin-producing) n=1 Tax=Thalassiosira oceanica TaxID=159749 RepID=K0SYA9_THAOC|nr:hypothetical protein THAOC_08269 [Thalassiosira oceanica]|eukprot:EJK70380.1 hypothetical protein THAOC_08269 [Thalassiosira oceanica]
MSCHGIMAVMRAAASMLLVLSPSGAFAFAPVARTRSRPLASGPLFSTATDTDASIETEKNPRLSGLALMLDDGTRKSHSIAENTQFVTGFFAGLADRDSYRIYEAMEICMDTTNEERVKYLDSPQLRRLPSIRKDMDFFYAEELGSDWDKKIEPSQASKQYVARIQEISETKPHLLIAHQYTRYLGDLFGGQMMGGMAARSLDLNDGEGTEFYRFEGIESTSAFITEWYKDLNKLDLTEKQKEEIVDEANLVFALNIAIFQEIEGSPIKAMFTLAISTLKQKLGIS